VCGMVGVVQCVGVCGMGMCGVVQCGCVGVCGMVGVVQCVVVVVWWVWYSVLVWYSVGVWVCVVWVCVVWWVWYSVCVCKHAKGVFHKGSTGMIVMFSVSTTLTLIYSA